MSDSHIHISAGGTTFAGRDATSLYRAITLRSALKLYHATKMRPNRAYTPTAMLATAGAITGKAYRRGQFQAAIDDLTVWIEMMKSALPVTQG